jgi:hypothetical protein
MWRLGSIRLAIILRLVGTRLQMGWIIFWIGERFARTVDGSMKMLGTERFLSLCKSFTLTTPRWNLFRMDSDGIHDVFNDMASFRQVSKFDLRSYFSLCSLHPAFRLQDNQHLESASSQRSDYPD